MSSLPATLERVKSSQPRPPRPRAQVYSRACIIPDGVNGAAHLAVYHPRTARLTYSGPPTGAGWSAACKLAKLLHAQARSVDVPSQVDALDRAMLYSEARDETLLRGLTHEQLELFWAAVFEHRLNAVRQVA